MAMMTMYYFCMLKSQFLENQGHYGQFLSWVAIYMHFQRFVDIIIKVCLFGGFFFGQMISLQFE